MKKYILLLILFTYSIVHADIKIRPSRWAVPVIGSSLKNLYALDKKVYRSEQPNRKELMSLEKFGIKEVLNLRKHHTDDDEAKNAKIKLHHIKMKASKIKYDQLVKALKIIKEAKGPILIHCWHGSDRTGLVAAAYRIVFQNWSKENAIQELKEGGYGYHSRFYPNIVKMLESLDVALIKKELGLPNKTEDKK